MQMQLSKYAVFYFEGRDDAFDEDDLDLEKLAEDALASTDDPYAVVHREVAKLAVPLEGGKAKREWLEDYKDAIDEMKGCDPDEAYRHFLAGQVDETTASVLSDVLDLMDPREEESEDDEDEDGDEEDGEGEDEE